jgi:hypothetical protein
MRRHVQAVALFGLCGAATLWVAPEARAFGGQRRGGTYHYNGSYGYYTAPAPAYAGGCQPAPTYAHGGAGYAVQPASYAAPGYPYAAQPAYATPQGGVRPAYAAPQGQVYASPAPSIAMPAR